MLVARSWWLRLLMRGAGRWPAAPSLAAITTLALAAPCTTVPVAASSNRPPCLSPSRGRVARVWLHLIVWSHPLLISFLMRCFVASNSSNVLLPMPLPTRNTLRKALADIIRAVQSQNSLTDEQLAGELHVSAGTIANVRNERTDLNQETIAKLGARFGVETLDPWSACFGGRNVPREASEGRVSLTAITGSLHKLSLATDPDSQGGETVTHCELADMVSELRATQRLVNGLLARAERMGMAA